MNDPSNSEPAAWLPQLTPHAGGLQRLLAKRAQRIRQRLEMLVPALALSASLAIVLLVLRGPSIDLDAVREQLAGRGTTLQLVGEGQVVLEQRAAAPGVHLYLLQRSAVATRQ